ncbi:OLC1v1034675C1 [Oldenlandia corymbosa var. corymbosa]|uniref:OLC1v1034675C1 n=1 Tax=Oldenlandia corymbosa var. corymbosa TaxID=529605 RepID=A0AAV1CRS4_OLDCO|nr:OLC1v1034675C1 [Oldenlandia corymbosa var. corymbosa]
MLRMDLWSYIKQWPEVSDSHVETKHIPLVTGLKWSHDSKEERKCVSCKYGYNMYNLSVSQSQFCAAKVSRAEDFFCIFKCRDFASIEFHLGAVYLSSLEVLSLCLLRRMASFAGCSLGSFSEGMVSSA